MKASIVFFLLCFSLAACSQQSTGYQNVDNAKFATLMNTPNTVILDVRTPEEYQQGHIPHATLINFHDQNFSQRLDSLDKSKTYLVYCAAGGRSSQASSLLEKKGFKNIYNLEHGFSQWNGVIEK
ncbi:MAG: rhodanese-like domain-containing protein [Chitinophagales bacterium]